MAISTAQTSTPNSGTGTSITTAFANAVTVGNGIVVSVNAQANSISGVLDNKGNAYALAKSSNFFGVQTASIYHCLNVTTGGSGLIVTVTYTGSTVTDELIATEVNGTLTLDVTNGSASNNQNPQAGPITTTFSDTIVFVSLEKGGSTITQPAGYTADVIGAGAAVAHNVYTTTQAGLDPQWTTTASSANARVIAAYTSSITASPTTPSGPPPPFILGPPMKGAPWTILRSPLADLPPTPVAPSSQTSPLAGTRGIVFGPPLRGAPWAHLRGELVAPPPDPVVPAPPRQPDSQYMGLLFGPPVMGAPWVTLYPLVVHTPLEVPPPPPTPNQTGADGFQFGPPMPGPWHARAVAAGAWDKGILPTPPPTPRPADQVGGRGKAKPLINRVPRENHERRLARISEELVAMVNSLVFAGILRQTANGQFELRPGSHVSDRDPTATDDKLAGVVKGALWLNETTTNVYICTDNSPNGAIWKLLA